MIDSAIDAWLAAKKKKELAQKRYDIQARRETAKSVKDIRQTHPHLLPRETYALAASGASAYAGVTVEVSSRRARKRPGSVFQRTLAALRRSARPVTDPFGDMASDAADTVGTVGSTIAAGTSVAGRALGGAIYDAAQPATQASAPLVRPVVEEATQQLGQAAGTAGIALGTSAMGAGATAQALGSAVASNPAAQVVARDARNLGGVTDRAVDGGLPQAVRDAPLPNQFRALTGKETVGEVTAGAGEVGKGTIRNALVAADVPLELVKGGFRGVSETTYQNALAGSYFNPISGLWENLKENSGNAGLGALASRSIGEDVDLGSGLMPGGQVYTDEAKASEGAKIRGQSISPGRIVATTVSDPGSNAYNLMSGVIDFAFTLTADPAAAAGAGVARAKAAKNLLAVPERLQGLTPTLNRMLLKSHRSETVAHRVTEFFESSKQGTAFVDWATDATAPEIWRALGKRTDPDLALRLGDTHDKKAVLEMLIEAGGGTIRNKPKVPAQWKGETVRNARLGSDVPGRKIEFEGPGRKYNARTAEDYLKNAGITDQATIDSVVDRMLRASVKEADVADRYDAVTFLMDTVSDELFRKVAPGTPLKQNRLRDLTRLWSEEVSTTTRYNIDAIGQNADFPGVKIGKDTLPAPTPHLVIEGLSNGVNLPDFRRIRRATSKYRNILANPEYDLRVPFATLDHIMTEIWKPMQLLRVAWPVRVLGEQGFRLGAAGYENPMTSTLSYLAAVIADDGWLGKHLPDAAKGRRHVDALGDFFIDRDKFVPYSTEIERASNSSERFFQRAQNIKYHGRTTVTKAERGSYVMGLADEQAQLAFDPVARRVLINGLMPGDVIPAPRAGMAVDTVSPRPSIDPAAELARRRGRPEGYKLGGASEPEPPYFGTKEEWDEYEALMDEWEENHGLRTEDVLGPEDIYPDLYPNSRPSWEEHWANAPAEARAIDTTAVVKGKAAKVNRHGIEAVKEWFFHSDLRERAMRMQTLNKGETRGDLMTRAASDRYIDSITYRIDVKTGGQPALREAIRHQKLDGVEMFGKDGRINPAYRKKLDEYVDVEGMPDEVKAPQFAQQDDEGMRLVTRRLFSLLMGKPDSKLFRQPMFREAYWRRMEELAELIDQPGQVKLGLNAAKAKLSKAEVDNLARATSKGTGTLTIEEASLLAKGHALEEVHDLLYDLSRRGQWADGLRILIPFGEAWKEVLTTWTKLLADNPNVVRRAQTTVDSARRSGFFFEDPTTKKESFGFPLSGAWQSFAAGVPFGYNGTVQALNMAFQIMPGVGPVGAWPLSFLVDHISNDGVRSFVSDKLFPYGEPDVSLGDIGSWFEGLAPPWFRKTAGSVDNEEMLEMFASSMQHVGEFLAATGKYDFSNPDDLVRWEQNTVSRAKRLTFIRGLSQMVLPTAPTPEWSMETKEGMKTVAFLKDELKRMEDDPAIGYDGAPRALLKKYGEEIFLILSPMSKGSAPPTETVSKWAEAHPKFRAKYGGKDGVYGYFAPPSAEGADDFDFDFYIDQMDRKERDRYNLPERVAAAHQRIGASWWSWAKEQVEGRTDKAARDFKNETATWLAKTYPGWQAPLPTGKVAEQVRKLQLAAKDKEVADSPVATALREYFGYREMVRKQMDPTKQTLSRAGKWAANHQWLSEWGQDIANRTPEFKRVWEQVLSRELNLIEEEAA